MKVFILAQGRSGSNTITKAIADAIDHKVPWVGEFDSLNIPFDVFEKQTDQSNIILKLHNNQKTDNFENQIDFLKYVHSKFDKVIYHARANTFDAGLSFENGMANENYSWTDNKYTPLLTRPEINHIRFASLAVADIIMYAKTFDHDVTFYEELFTGDKQRTIDTIKRWNIEFNSLSLNMLLERFNPKHKYTNNG